MEIKNLLNNEKDEDMKDLIKEELKKNLKKIKDFKKIIKNNKKNKNEKIILEIKSGVGGDESAIFISDLKKMYEKYAEKMKWKKKIISKTLWKFKGYKEVVIMIKGKNIYKKLKYESGVHRVQRLPRTENKERIHTSTCRVAVYKNHKIKIKDFKESDFKIETFKSSGAGGQHVNKTNSAVRITHVPSNIKVECQKERSQHKNKKFALKIIKTKIFFKENEKTNNSLKNKKKNLLGQGKRVEKVRTYNYKENRLTDHRFKINLNNLNKIMNGDLEKLIKKIKHKKKILKKNIKNDKKNYNK